MKGKFSIVTVKPNLAALTTALTATDLLFDWTPIEIPRGGCSIETIQMHYAGTNGAAQTPKDIELIFAKSVNGVAPPTLGTSNGAITSTAVAVSAKPHIIGYKHLDVSTMVDTGVDLVAYNLLGSFSAKPNPKMNIMLEGETTSYVSTKGPGYQTVWMAGLAIEGGEDFGAGVVLDGDQAAAVGTQTQLTVTAGGVDPGLVFAVGDEVIAQDGALVGTVVSIESNTAFTVDQVQAALADEDELCNRQPITFIFGLEY